jgi:uncharacterized protein (DUF4415 family)
MNANKTASARKLGSDLARVDAHVIAPHEYDELPEITDEMRLPEEVIQRWRATGPGWQTRMADRLKHLPK